MGKKFWVSISMSIMMSMLSSKAFAETAGDRCDVLAAHVDDKGRPANVKPVRYSALDGKAAVKACADAVAAFPNVMRYHFQLGRAANKAMDFPLSIKEYNIALDGGFALAGIGIAEAYFFGEGFEKDRAKGLSLMRELANADISSAAYYLGIWIRDGLGTKPDPVESLKWFRKAHELGHPDAPLDIGYAIESGAAGPVNYDEALRLYRIAADNGNAMAMNNIGVFYGEGKGVAKDTTKALVWYRKAQAHGNTLAYINIAGYADAGTAMDANPKEAVDLVLKAFELGDGWDDEPNAKVIYRNKYSAEFWRNMQIRLTEMGHYKGPVDGKPTLELREAFEKIVEKQP